MTVPGNPADTGVSLAVHIATSGDAQALPRDLRESLDQLAETLRRVEREDLVPGGTVSNDFRVCTAQLITECRPRIDVTVTFGDPGRVIELDDPQREQQQ